MARKARKSYASYYVALSFIVLCLLGFVMTALHVSTLDEDFHKVGLIIGAGVGMMFPIAFCVWFAMANDGSYACLAQRKDESITIEEDKFIYAFTPTEEDMGMNRFSRVECIVKMKDLLSAEQTKHHTIKFEMNTYYVRTHDKKDGEEDMLPAEDNSFEIGMYYEKMPEIMEKLHVKKLEKGQKKAKTEDANGGDTGAVTE